MWFRILKKPISDIRDKMDVPEDMRTIATQYKGVFDPDHWRSENPLSAAEANTRMPFGGTGQKPFGLWWGLGTQWVDWVTDNMGSEHYKYFYEVKIVGNVLQLKTKQDHIDFYDKYAVDTFTHWKSNVGLGADTQEQREARKKLSNNWHQYDWTAKINWKRVTADYDGIEVMGGKFHNAALYDDQYARGGRDKDFPRGTIKWVYSWDVDSGVVWNTDAIKVGKLLFSEADPEWKPVPEWEDDD